MSESEDTEQTRPGDVAIIGVAGRFPGACDLEAFWEKLCQGVESITRFAPEELEASRLFPATRRSHPDFVPRGAVLGDGERFDHAFFGFPRAEAQLLDPQLRLFLECAFAALEDAGYDPQAEPGKIALYAGAGLSSHLLSLVDRLEGEPAALFEVGGTASAESLAMRVAHKLGLRGESISVYTACSTGLVAVHMACQSLLLRQSDMAMAGGVRLSLPERTGYVFQEGMIFSPDGHCRAFDERAQGTVVGHGAGVVVLKLLEDALRDGDHVYAVIRGSAINNDGADKVGFTAPSIAGQAEVIRQALDYAEVDPDTIAYVEAHGTGTPLGDPIEIEALSRVYREHTKRRGYCAIGSLKTNIGHLDTAAGVAGLIKAALVLDREEIPPSLHFESPNPKIDFAASPFFVNTALRPFPRGERPRRVAVSSFGIGGTNAHVVLEEAPRLESEPGSRDSALVLLSARTKSALAAATTRLAEHIERHPEARLEDVAYTLCLGRRAFRYRRAIVAKDHQELVRRLRERLPEPEEVGDDASPRVAFLFPGQGSQAVGMGAALYRSEPSFRRRLEEASERLRARLGCALPDVLYPRHERLEEAKRALEEPAVALPALLAVQVALAELWESWGVRAEAFFGHSFGEYSAACLAGVLSFEDALSAAYERGRLLARTARGAMLSVAMPPEELEAMLSAELSLAAVNGRERAVVAGPPEAVEALAAKLLARKVATARLPVRHAFHSPLVEPILDELRAVMAGLRLRAPERPYVSSASGAFVRAEQAMDPGYWAMQTRAPVRFAAGLDTLFREGFSVYLEVGADQALSTLARAELGRSICARSSLPRAGSARTEDEVLLASLGALWARGVMPDWKAFFGNEARRRVPLPTYPFEGPRLPSPAVVETGKRARVREDEVEDTPEQAPSPEQAPEQASTELLVAAVWGELLGIDKVSAHDNFLELGGNSLLAAQALSRLRDRFGVEIPLTDLFEAPTVAELAQRIDARLGTVARSASPRAALPPALPLVALPRREGRPLSCVEERVLALEALSPGTPALNMPIVIGLVGPLARERLERALAWVVERHEILRTVYPRAEAGPVPTPLRELLVPIAFHDLRDLPPDERAARSEELSREEAERPFDLVLGPPLRATLLRLGDEEHRLFLTVHHVASDTGSLLILARELSLAYGALARGEPSPLAPLALQYGDFAAWQRRALGDGSFADKIAFWRERLADLPTLGLLEDRKPTSKETLQSARVCFHLPPGLSQALHAFSQKQGTTPFVTLLAAYAVLLARHAHQSEVVVGTPVGNRERTELAPLIGYVAQSIGLRIDLGGAPGFIALVRRVREVVLEAQAHADVPFEALASELGRTRDPSKTRLFDAVFVLHGAFAEHAEQAGVRFELIEAESATQFGATLAGLSLNMRELEAGLMGVLRYDPNRFDAATISRLAARFTSLLAAALAEPETSIAALPLACAEDRAELAAARDRAARVPVRPLFSPNGLPKSAWLLEAGERLDAAELMERAGTVAGALEARGLGRGAVIGLRLARVRDTLVALLGVVWAGAAVLLEALGADRDDAQLAEVIDERAFGELCATPARTPSRPAMALDDAALVVRLRAGMPPIVLSHRNLGAFAARLDEALGHAPGVWLAAGDSMRARFWIEILWALGRGFGVVVPPAEVAAELVSSERPPLAFSLFYFGADETAAGAERYRLLLEGARRADELGFAAVWTPERHFHSFGGLYPSPAVLSAALAIATTRIGLRAGSVVMPLHHPVRVAEEWAVIDNLSGGRVGVSFASGWHSRDFVFSPGRYAQRKELMAEGLSLVRRLWRGEEARLPDGEGREIQVRIQPRPVQPELPVWLTSGGNRETFRLAGALGMRLLTNLMGQQVEDLADKISVYREAWEEQGHGPGRGHVTLMMHAFVGADLDTVRATVRAPMLAYLKSSLDVMGSFAATVGIDTRALAPRDLEALLQHGFDRYLHAGGLFGTPSSCLPLVEEVRRMDVDEIACLIDFGVATDAVLEGLESLAELMRLAQDEGRSLQRDAYAQLATLIVSEGVTHLPSSAATARALGEREPEALARLRALVLDGAMESTGLTAARVVAQPLPLEPWAWRSGGAEIAVLDRHGAPLPWGVPGELALVGADTPLAYLGDTDERGDLLSPLSATPWARRYRTGRLCRRRREGAIELLGPIAPGDRAAPGEAPPRRAPPIERVAKRDDLPLSFAQQRLFYLDQLAPGNPAYNNAVALLLSGPLDMAALTRSLEEVIARHEVLRTSFPLDPAGVPVQRIAETLPLAVPLLEIDAKGEDAQRAELTRRIAAIGRAPFDLAEPPLLRAAIFRLDAREHVLVVVLHHILSDGWSAGVLFAEISQIYRAFHRGEASPLPPLPVQYGDYSVWQRAWMQGEVLETELAFFRETLAGKPLVFDFPTDFPRPPVMSARGARCPVRIPRGLSDRLAALCREEGATLFMGLLAALSALLFRYTRKDFIAIGSPVAGRSRTELEGLVGCFVNTLVLGMDLGEDPSFRELCARARRTALAAYAHQDLPFEKLVDALSPERELNRMPLVQVMLVLQNTPVARAELGELQLRGLPVETDTAKLDMVLELSETPEGLAGWLEYSTDLFASETMERLVRQLEALLDSALEDPTKRLSQLSRAEGSELRALLGWGTGARRSLAEQTFPALFRAQLARTPEVPALVSEHETLTYAELARRVDCLAQLLCAGGVGPEEHVGICLERSVEQIVALLAILGAGGAYMPLDPSHPRERLDYMLQDSGARRVVTDRAHASRFSESGLELICLDELAQPQRPLEKPRAHLHPDNAAYSIYTSGSTGKPKGVTVSHRSLCNMIDAQRRMVDLEPGDAVLQFARLGFDASVSDIFGTLGVGATLHLASSDQMQPGPDLAKLLRERAISFVTLPPAALSLLPEEDLPALRAVGVGAEACPPELARVWGQRLRLVNVYGPTEATVFSTTFEFDPALLSFPIGHPKQNARAYVLGPDLSPMPLGVPGELYIGGENLARGYLRRPDLTAARFVPDPFAPAPGARIYRTGDRARWLARGELEFLGRVDHQVKIRGYRIELGEIEAALGTHPAVRACVVVVREQTLLDKRLVAYVVLGDRATSTKALREHLSVTLPGYMVPSAFVVLEAMPLTSNGKVDRKALPAPDMLHTRGESEFTPPRTTNEAQIAAIWCELLRTPRVGVHDNFFEIGGDSILSIQVVARARRVGISLSPRLIHQHPTIAALAALAETQRPRTAIEEAQSQGEMPLLPMHRSFLEGASPRLHPFNQARLVAVQAPLKLETLNAALRALIAHHDALRLRFRCEGGEWKARFGDIEGAFTLERVELGALPNTEIEAAISARASALQASLDLATGPLVRVAYFDLGSAQRLLILTHPFVVDGVSWRILLDDLGRAITQLSRGEPVALPPKTTSYKAWSERLVAFARSEELARELGFWTRPTIPAKRLPRDRGAHTLATTQTLTVALGRETTAALLQRVPGAYRSTVNDVLLTALTKALLDWIGGSSVRISLEGHGREARFDGVDLSRTLGCFTTPVPVALLLEGAYHPGRALKSIKEQLRSIPHHGLGYGLLRYLGPEEARSALSRQPEPEVAFTYLGELDTALFASELLPPAKEPIGPMQDGGARRPEHIDINAMVIEERLEIALSYSRAAHPRDTIERFAAGFLRRLEELIAHGISPDAGGVTPSDFPLITIGQEALDRLWGDGRDIEDIYRLSPMQQGMLYHTIREPESGVYVEQVSCVLEGLSHVGLFEEAWARLVQAEPVLRSSFHWEGLPEPVQVVHRSAELSFVEEDWRDSSEHEARERLATYLERDRHAGFDATRAPLMRLFLARLGEDRHALVWSHHHILMDGWCVSLILKDLFSLYEACLRGEKASVVRQGRFRDYIAWLSQQDLAKAEAYWREQLRGFEKKTSLGLARPFAQGFVRVAGELSEQTSEALLARARRHRLTLGTLLHGAWALLLSRYSGEQDIVFGSTSSGRPAELADIESIVGLFLTTMPLRVRIHDDEPLLALLERLSSQQVEMRQHEAVALWKVQAQSELPPGEALFDTLLVFENHPVDEAIHTLPGGLRLSQLAFAEQTNYPITAVASPGPKMKLELRVDQAWISNRAAGELLSHWRTLLEAMAEGLECEVRDLPMLSEEERHRLLVQWNHTAAEYPRDACIHTLFEEQVERSPDAVAIVFEDKEISYRELNERANRLAHYLKRLGARPERVVGLLLERSLDMIVAILGILKTGGAYLPLDPAQPSERLSFLLEDSGASLLLCHADARSQIPPSRATTVCIDRDGPLLAQESAENLGIPTYAENLFSIIYTSGSTGRPKGVAAPHRGALNRFSWMWSRFPFQADEVCVQKTTLSFVDAVWEIFGPLLRGVRLVIVPEHALRDVHALVATLSSCRATRIVLVPSLLSAILDLPLDLESHLPCLKHWVSSGEALSPALAQRFCARLPDRELINLYGASELAGDATCHVVEGRGAGDRAIVPIGRPLSNTIAHVLDPGLRPVPLGVSGELYIGGDGLARGYLNRPGLSATRFVPNPLGEGRLYRTGDLARYLPDGSLEFLGRIDHQLKLRGHRIEPGEIEARILETPGISACVVVARDERLLAYLVARADTLDRGALRKHLQDGLPEIMVPSAFVFLEALPSTPSGKVDRTALPAPESRERDLRGQLPLLSPTEELLSGIFAEVLRISHVGRNENFFELGGHSLLATQVISRIRSTFGVELPLRVLFDAPDPEGLAQRVEAKLATRARVEQPAILPVPREGDLALSFAQQRLWFLDKLEPQSAAYTMPYALRLSGKLDREALRAAFEAMVERHESLRTTFGERDGVPIQRIDTPSAFELPILDLSFIEESEISRRVAEEAQRPFDLATGPLLRASLLYRSQDEHVLVFCMHHIISDGWSMQLFARELIAHYEAFSSGRRPNLPELPIHYADYAAWQRNWLSGELLERQLDTWRKALAGLAPLELPTDHARLSGISRRGAWVEVELSTELSTALRALAQRQGVTLFMLLLAAFQVLLGRLAGTSDVAVGSPIAGRTHKDVEGLIGFFVNTLVLRADLSNNPSFLELCAQVKDTTLTAYAHQELPFEKLVEELAPTRDPSRSPLFQVMFALQNVPVTEALVEGVRMRPLTIESGTAKFDLTLLLRETEGQIQGVLEYAMDVFEQATAVRMVERLRALLEGVVRAPETRVMDLPLLSASEREMLAAWNATSTPHQEETTVHARFEAQVDRTPEAQAVVFEDKHWSYAELDRRANGIAHLLRAEGVGPEMRVGLYLDRSLDLVTALFGILKAGGAYVPLDPHHPRERLEGMIADSGARVVVTKRSLAPELSHAKAKLICLDAVVGRDDRPPPTGHSENAAYVIYTSGSTGRPKGVVVSHGSVVQMAMSVQATIAPPSPLRVTLNTPLTFDASVQQWSRLLFGDTLFIVPEEERLDAARMLAFLERRKIDVLECTPAQLGPLLQGGLGGESLGSPRLVFVGGEAMDASTWERLAQKDRTTFFNVYGPTECTVVATAIRIDPSARPTLGRPLSHVRAYVLDAGFEPLPIGVPGELFLSGAGVARAYLDRPALTAERFVPDPFSSTPGARMYRTGDLARFRPDGVLAFVGRIDHQVKIRGYRIELGEIETVLRAQAGVRETTVVVREDDTGNKQLVAYYIPEHEAPSPVLLREALARTLPDYMLPSAYIVLEAWPLLQNGKLDRRSLPAPDEGPTNELPQGPRTPIEEQLCAIFAEVLRLSRVGTSDSFFALGGHSLLATQVVSRVRATLGVELPLRALFEADTVASLAARIERLSHARDDSAEEIDREEGEL